MIHPTAIVSPRAVIGSNVEIGPYAIIGESVTIGDGTVIGAHTTVDPFVDITVRENMTESLVFYSLLFGIKLFRLFLVVHPVMMGMVAIASFLVGHKSIV